MSALSSDATLLEALTRPDGSLVEHHLEATLRFNEEHRQRLAAVEAALGAGTVADGPGDPVLLSVQPPDRVDMINLARTGDTAFNKVMVCFCALAEEVSFLRATAEAKFFSQLQLFGHSQNDDAEDWGDGLLEAQVGLSLSLFADAGNFVRRVNTVVRSIVHQVRALFGREAGLAGGFVDVRLAPVVIALGSALSILLTLDAVLVGNPTLIPAWEKFKRVAEVMRSDPSKFGVDAGRADAFDGLIKGLDAGLLRGNTLQRCLDQEFETRAEAENGGSGYKEWLRERSLEQLEALFSGVGSESETTEASSVPGQYAVYALYRALMGGRGVPDVLKKQFEQLWRMQERVPFVVLWGKAVWLPDQFLIQYAAVPGIIAAKLVPRDPRIVRNTAAEALETGLPGSVNIMHARVTAWLVRAHMAFCDTPLVSRLTTPAEVVRGRTLLITQAICLGYAAHRTLTRFVGYAFFLGRPIPRRCVGPLSRLAELCKVLEGALRTYNLPIVETLPHIHREACAGLLELVMPLQLRGGGTKKAAGDRSARYIGAAGELVVDLCSSTESWTPARRLLLELALSVGTQKGGIAKPAEVTALGRTTWSLGLLSDYATHARALGDTSILYWVRELIPAMVASAATATGGAALDHDCRHGSRLAHLFAALSDPARMLSNAVHLPPPQAPWRRIVGDRLLVSGEAPLLEGGAGGGAGASPTAPMTPPAGGSGLSCVEHLLTAYERLLHGIVNADLVKPLCAEVETDLRVQVHAVHLAHREAPPLRGSGRLPLVHLLSAPPFRVVSILVDLKAEVTAYLTKTFYELTTVALHDWKTYGEMAALAGDKYGLSIPDNYLPMGCLDQGLDVLQIMRNIHVFVARYTYNLNQQFFLEKKSVKGAKHLHVVTISSIASSIRQHGSGMQNTTVNFAYQFLSQKFFVFSQFLFDDYIKSHLARERRFFRKDRKELGNCYPYDHAAALVRDIKSLGLTPDKQSFLDKFRGVVSEVGNALGYVRMVRSAGMHATAEAVKFVPDIAAVPTFEAAATRVEGEAVAAAAVLRAAEVEAGGDGATIPTPKGLSAPTLEAARQLDAVLSNLTASFSEGSDYFKLLVTVFQHVLLSPGGAAAGGGSSAPAAGGPKEGDSHLRNFFLIVPALTISFVDALRLGKDRMEKSVKGAEAYFTEDGFAVGLAYILAILKQDRAFDSLHWWDSITRYHKAELASYRAEGASLGKSKADVDRAEELSFKQRRVLSAQAEFDSLFFAFSGARLFFKVDEEEDITTSVDKVLS